MKLHLYPIKPEKGYMPQDAVYDWMTGHEFRTEKIGEKQKTYTVSCEDLPQLVAKFGVDSLVFVCEGNKSEISLKESEGFDGLGFLSQQTISLSIRNHNGEFTGMGNWLLSDERFMYCTEATRKRR